MWRLAKRIYIIRVIRVIRGDFFSPHGTEDLGCDASQDTGAASQL
jgi:hypothetical protein